eukprot:989333-Rhodomonas_salina.2
MAPLSLTCRAAPGPAVSRWALHSRACVPSRFPANGFASKLEGEIIVVVLLLHCTWVLASIEKVDKFEDT